MDRYGRNVDADPRAANQMSQIDGELVKDRPFVIRYFFTVPYNEVDTDGQTVRHRWFAADRTRGLVALK